MSDFWLDRQDSPLNGELLGRRSPGEDGTLCLSQAQPDLCPMGAYILCEWHSLAWATWHLGEFDWTVGSEAQESAWAGEGGQRIKSTEAVMEVLEVAWGMVQSGKHRPLGPALMNTLEHRGPGKGTAG